MQADDILDYRFTRGESFGDEWTFLAGPAGSAGHKIMFGEGPPAPSLGSDGWFYVDIDADMGYGPRAGTWPAGSALVAADLSTDTFAAQLRRSFDDDDAIDFEIDTSDAATGVIRIGLTAIQTADLERIYAWDLRRTDADGFVEVWLAGTVTVDLNVTRDEGS